MTTLISFNYCNSDSSTQNCFNNTESQQIDSKCFKYPTQCHNPISFNFAKVTQMLQLKKTISYMSRKFLNLLNNKFENQFSKRDFIILNRLPKYPI